MADAFDYIIIGAGSAGCILANRLTADGQHTVCLLEAGPRDWNPYIHIPAGFIKTLTNPSVNWMYTAEPSHWTNGRAIGVPRGKTLGGSSAINGHIYNRGQPDDFNSWAQRGNRGWGYADVLPYFKRMEHAHGGDDGFRGRSGPLHVTRGKRDNPLHDAFVQAAEQAGYTATSDYNGYRQEGFGAADMTVYQGRRWSAANAYLKPALKRGNLKLITRARVDRILFEGKRAVGVRYIKGGQSYDVKVSREVISAAGAINSPQILQRSGIGPAALLKSHGITPIADRGGVGENLQDHLEVYFQVECLQPITLYKHLNLFSKARIGAQWLFTKTGPGTTNHFETLGFIRSDKGVSYPDIQYHFLPVAIRYDGTAPSEGHGFQLHVGPMRSKSRGHVRIKSAEAGDAPEIKFNYMSHPDDWVEFRKCIRLSREILHQSAMDPFRGREIQPGDDATSDAAIDAFIREHAESAYHPCGTMRMGDAADPMAVVDPECRVIGVEGLRVADSSIFPRITNGNLNAPSIMTGEKAADHILGRQPLPRANDTPFVFDDWETRQR